MRQLDLFLEHSTNQSNFDLKYSENLKKISEKSYDIDSLGQVFTPSSIVRAMISLRKNNGRILEPSCGNGAFSNFLPGCVAIEIDPDHAPPGSINIDFFAYPESEKFETIIGNPPYVKYQNIVPETKRLIKSNLLDRRSNLYLFFIEKSIRHLKEGGEIIFITPRDFLKATSSIHLNKWLYSLGTITHAIELGDSNVFENATPNCLIWRYEKGNLTRYVQFANISNKDNLEEALNAIQWEKRYFVEVDGHLIFSKYIFTLRLKDIASVKVGAVSGADDIYADEHHGNREFVCSSTVKTGKTRKMIWIDENDSPPEVLLPHKSRLISRKIRAFDESNWWKWGRGYPITDDPRVYVNCKTRHKKPFFIHECNNFDGSVLAIFPHNKKIDLKEFCDALNSVPWDQLGFVCDGRYLFSQRSLENAPLPESFEKFLPNVGGN